MGFSSNKIISVIRAVVAKADAVKEKDIYSLQNAAKVDYTSNPKNVIVEDTTIKIDKLSEKVNDISSTTQNSILPNINQQYSELLLKNGYILKLNISTINSMTLDFANLTSSFLRRPILFLLGIKSSQISIVPISDSYIVRHYSLTEDSNNLVADFNIFDLSMYNDSNNKACINIIDAYKILTSVNVKLTFQPSQTLEVKAHLYLLNSHTGLHEWIGESKGELVTFTVPTDIKQVTLNVPVPTPRVGRMYRVKLIASDPVTGDPVPLASTGSSVELRNLYCREVSVVDRDEGKVVDGITYLIDNAKYDAMYLIVHSLGRFAVGDTVKAVPMLTTNPINSVVIPEIYLGPFEEVIIADVPEYYYDVLVLYRNDGGFMVPSNYSILDTIINNELNTITLVNKVNKVLFLNVEILM